MLSTLRIEPSRCCWSLAVLRTRGLQDNSFGVQECGV